MRSTRGVARFAVVGDEDGRTWGRFADIDGLFGDPHRWPEERSALITGWSPEPAAGELGNAYIQILDTRGEPIGRYYAGGFTIVASRPSTLGEALADLDVEIYVFVPPGEPEKAMWERWRSELPAGTGLWAGHPADGRAAWLRMVAAHEAFHRRRVPEVGPGQVVTLEGGDITDVPSFYCALGEAVNGPLGYFGNNLDALVDCLHGGFGADGPFTLVWRDSVVAQEHLDHPVHAGEPGPSYLAEILDIFRERQVEVVLE